MAACRIAAAIAGTSRSAADLFGQLRDSRCVMPGQILGILEPNPTDDLDLAVPIDTTDVCGYPSSTRSPPSGD
jgi:hypothetical protein